MNEILKKEFINAYHSFTGKFLNIEALMDVTSFYPDEFGGYTKKDLDNPQVAVQGADRYLDLIGMYLKNYKLPETIEGITVAYDLGFDALIKKGLLNIPNKTKALVGKMRKALEPQALIMEENI